MVVSECRSHTSSLYIILAVIRIGPSPDEVYPPYVSVGKESLSVLGRFVLIVVEGYIGDCVGRGR